MISQPAIFVASMAAVEKLKATEEGAATIAAADVACGLSLGEYTALCFAGAISFEDGVKITKARGEAMQAASEAASSGMVSVIGLKSDQVEALCKAAAEQSGEPVQIANYLCNGNYACSGSTAAVAKVRPAPTHYRAMHLLHAHLVDMHLLACVPLTVTLCISGGGDRQARVQGAHGRQAGGGRRLPHGFHEAGRARARGRAQGGDHRQAAHPRHL